MSAEVSAEPLVLPDEPLTVADLAEWPEDDLRRIELLDGVLLVTPPPTWRHTDTGFELAVCIREWARATDAGKVLVAPTGVQFADDSLLEPDLLYLDAQQAALLSEDPYVQVVPRLVVEVSSPSTRSRDLGLKRDAYDRFGVDEYWFVDLDRQRVLVHRRDGRRYGDPVILDAGETLTSPNLPGFGVEVSVVLRPSTG